MPTPPAPVSTVGYVRRESSPGATWWEGVDEEETPDLQWPLSNLVYDRMRRQDAQVASVLRAVTMPVRRTTWWVEQNGASDEVTAHVAQDLGLPIHGGEDVDQPKRLRDRFSWSEHQRLALLMLPFGHSFFEQQYRITDNGQRAHLRKLEWRPPRTISKFNVASDGGLMSIEQDPERAGQGTPRIDVSRLVAYVNDLEGGRWQGTSLLRPAYKHWLVKDRLIRTQAQVIDRNGMGVPVYYGADGESDLSGGLSMAKGLRSGESAGASVPFGAKLALQGVEGATPDAMPAIDYHDQQIARAVLAHFLNLGTQTGSWALGSTFADFFTLSLQTIAAQLADVATQHIVEDIVDVNWGEDEPAPKIGFEEIGSRQFATAQAIKLLADAGIILPDRAIEEATRQQYGLPRKDPDAPDPGAVPPAAPGPPAKAPPAENPPADDGGR